MTKICNNLLSGCNYECTSCEVPTIEPEDCEYCLEEAEENGIEYEANFTYRNGVWQCDNCNRLV